MKNPGLRDHIWRSTECLQQQLLTGDTALSFRWQNQTFEVWVMLKFPAFGITSGDQPNAWIMFKVKFSKMLESLIIVEKST